MTLGVKVAVGNHRRQGEVGQVVSELDDVDVVVVHDLLLRGEGLPGVAGPCCKLLVWQLRLEECRELVEVRLLFIEHG